jgi:hypothetical protein
MLSWLRGRTARNQPAVSAPFLRELRRHALPVLEHQLHLDRLAGDEDWWIDQGEGTLTLGPSLILPLQFIGSESERARTWRWSWANEYVDDALKTKILELRDIGAREGIPELAEPEFRLKNGLPGHAVATVASGMIGADAYYRTPYPGGAAFVFVTLDDHQRRPDLAPLDRALGTLSASFLALPVAPTKDDVREFLVGLGLETRVEDRSLVASDSSRALRIDFDGQGRISSIGTV